MKPHPFGWLDWSVLAAYASVVLGIGFHFGRKQRTTEEYFLGGRRMNPILAGISVFAAYFSIISYIATPGEYVGYGPVLACLATIVALPIVFFVVGYLLIPVIMRLPISSAFELLEGRLGRAVRQVGSLAYILGRLVWMALILYTCSELLVLVLGCDPSRRTLIAAVIGGVTTTYTVMGGIRTVMITEVVQSSMLMTGALFTIVLISFQLGGVGAWWPTHWETHWIAQPFYSPDLHIRATLVGAFLTSVLGGICITISDQGAVQRLLTTRDAKAARRAYLLSNITIVVVVILLSLVGAALIAFFRSQPEAAPSDWTFAKNGDAYFPYYISRYLPSGISGMVVASLLAAAMSCLAGGINSTVTVVTKDFIEIDGPRPGRSEAARLRLTRLLVLVLGCGEILASIGMGAVKGNLNEVAGKTLSLVLCSTFGLFFLAIFVKFSTPFGAIWGAVYSTAAAGVIAFWDVFTGQPGISFLWLIPLAFVVSLVTGCLFSLLPTRGRSGAVLAAYSAGAALPLLGVVAWLISLRP